MEAEIEANIHSPFLRNRPYLSSSDGSQLPLIGFQRELIRQLHLTVWSGMKAATGTRQFTDKTIHRHGF